MVLRQKIYKVYFLSVSSANSLFLFNNNVRPSRAKMTKTSYHGGYGVCAEMADQADLRPEKPVAVGTGDVWG